jgi:hypothetical protein
MAFAVAFALAPATTAIDGIGLFVEAVAMDCAVTETTGIGIAIFAVALAGGVIIVGEINNVGATIDAVATAGERGTVIVGVEELDAVEEATDVIFISGTGETIDAVAFTGGTIIVTVELVLIVGATTLAVANAAGDTTLTSGLGEDTNEVELAPANTATTGTGLDTEAVASAAGATSVSNIVITGVV